MSKRKDSVWWIVIVVLLIFIVAIGLSEIKKDKIELDEDELERRREQEEKLLKELEDLEMKHELYEKHKFLMEFTDNYLEKLSEKRYNQFIRWGIISIIILNGLIAVLFPAITILDLISWYGIAIIIFDIFATIIFVNIAKAKGQIKNFIRLQIEGKIYGNRDNKYFKDKIIYYERELERLKSGILVRKSELKKFGNRTDISKSSH